jgi:drug/metabolite transporter (DMT)-like permease
MWYKPVHAWTEDIRLTRRRENASGVIYLLLTALCWGFVASTVKQLTTEVDPYTISFSRVVLATATFVPLFVRRGGNWRSIKWFAPWVLVGALGRAGNYILYNTGLTQMPSNATTILAPVQAIGNVLSARWFIGERLRGKWPGVVPSMVGLTLIWWNGKGWATLIDPRYIVGNAMLVLAGVASALHFASQRVLSATLSGPEILLPVFAWSTALTVPFAWAAGGFNQSYSPAAWLLILVLGIALTGGSFFFLGEGYKRCDASTAVVITNTSTFLTLVWSALLMQESVSLVMVLGVLLGVTGAVLVVLADRQRLGKEGTENGN